MFEQRFLDQQNAILDADGNIGFPGFDVTSDPCPDTFISIVPGFGLLRVSGTDAGEFLHAQLTCDVNRMADGTGSTAAWCNPKGRVITTFVIYRLADEFFLLLPAVLQETVVKRLRMFVLRAEVEITDVTADRSVLGVRGRTEPLPLSEHPFSIHNLNDRLHLFLPDHGGESRCLIVDDTEKLESVWQGLAGAMQPVDSRCWQRLDMEAGIPWLNESTTEQFLPQELNLEDTGGLSFNKGCYPGQEVVARVHYRGQVKRRLYHATAEADAAITAGTKVKDSDGKSVGLIVTSAPCDAGLLALAVIDTGSAGSGALALEHGGNLHITAVSSGS